VTFKIVILSARPSNLIPCVCSVLNNEPTLPPDHIIVVDDGARQGAESQLPGIRWVTGVKPFNFARNTNIGMREAFADVIMLNDDARLLTYQGFSQLVQEIQHHPEVGICSAGIRGVIGNPRQLVSAYGRLRTEPNTLAFVCVFIRKRLYEQIGLLDEQFDGYGFEDNDYCRRALRSGWKLGIWDGCIVDHSGELSSTFRSRPDLHELFVHNQRLFNDKANHSYSEKSLDSERVVDLLYLACNRLEFTQETFSTLIATTDWRFVHELFVYDDGSIDGTSEWLEHSIHRVPAPVRFVKTHFGSPVSAMSHFIEAARAPILAKTDNDAMLPPDWLRQSLEVLQRHPELMLLGIEAMNPVDKNPHRVRSYTLAEFISGLGLYRRIVFAQSRPTAYEKYFGLEEWQVAQGVTLRRGWINPALPVFLLDRTPFAPWTTYSATYIGRGWQRSSPPYDPSSRLWSWWHENNLTMKSTEENAEAVPVIKFEPVELPRGDARFLGALRIKNEAKHIHQVINSILPICQRIFVFDDHSTDETVAVCESFGERVKVYRSFFTGLDEARDKNFLLGQIIQAEAEWVLWIDGDEVLERRGSEHIRQVVDTEGIAIYSLKIAYMWNDSEHVRVDGIYGRFTRPSLFRLKNQAMQRLYFPTTGCGGNFHCGNVPRGLSGRTQELDLRLKHLGYMTREQRQSKFKWYTATDPNNDLEDNYRHLAEIPGARHAPDSARILQWSQWVKTPSIEQRRDVANNAVIYAKSYSRSHDVVIRVYNAAGNVIETHEHKSDFKEW
jgi:GT2 family glycosyltransferase